MKKVRAGFGQRTVLHLEPSRAAAAVGSAIVLVLMSVVVAGALTFQTAPWSQRWRDDGVDPTDQTLLIIAGVAGFLGLIGLLGVLVNGSRWRIARRVLRASENPALASLLPTQGVTVSTHHPAVIPPLEVRFVTPRKLPKIREKLHRVTPSANVIGRPPMHIAYLRLFDNQPRLRTFVESAWREFGYVYLLRAATSVTRREYRAAKGAGGIAHLFVTDEAQFEYALGQHPVDVLPKGRRSFDHLGPSSIRVRDPYGSYPVRAVLCHGNFWKRAVDILLDRVDLAVTDLSGYTERNAGTAHEMQRVIDRVPIERVVFLRDERSNKKFLEHEIRRAWSTMAADSPNATGSGHTVVVAVTDHFRSSSSTTAGGQESTQVRLEADRRTTRRLVAAAQHTVEQYGATHRTPA